MNFENKVIWITGASSGIGAALAKEFSRMEGIQLILSSRNETQLKKVQLECEHPRKIKIIPLDLEYRHDFDFKVAQALSFFGAVDILVHCGGISQRAIAKDTYIAVDQKIMNVNFLGTIALTKALLPHFIANDKGHFVVVSSVVGKFATPKRSSYAASKHALHGFFDSLRSEVYDNNIKVTLICPGYVKTQLSIHALTGDGSPQQKMDNTTANGMPPDLFAQKMISAIFKEKEEVYIGGFKEKLGIYIKRFFPLIFSKMVRKTNTA